MCLAIPGRILSITGDELDRMGRVDFEGVVKEVNLSLVPEAKIGEYVIVHVGMALSTVDAEAAAEVFSYLRQMDELGEVQEAEEGGTGAPAGKTGTGS